MRIKRLPNILQMLLPSAIWHVPLCPNKVFFTFDDGPDEIVTPQMLKLLQRHQAQASFFVLGEKAKRQPELIKSIREKGHTIGLHSYLHLPLIFQSAATIFDQLALSKNVLQDLLGERIKYVRPPYGKAAGNFFRACRQLNLQIVMWNIMSYDFDLSFSDEQIYHLIDSQIRGGDLIVFHDGHKNSQRTVNILGPIIDMVKQKNFQFAALEMGKK